MNSSTLFGLGCYAFVSLGISAAIIGPALPALSARSGVSIEQLGMIFSTMSLGYLSSAPVIHLLSPRIGLRNMMIGSPVLVIIAMTTLALGQSIAVFCLATFLLGLGQSGTQVSYNTVVGLQYEGAKSSGALNRMNAFFGIGALIGPLIVSLGYSLLSNPDVALWFSAACALPLSIAAILLGGEVTKLRTAHADASATQTNQTSTMRQVFASPVFWVMCAVMGLYVGCEVAFSGWATEYTRRLALTTTAQAAIAVSAFWMGLAFSRYFTEALIKRMSPANFMVLTIFVAMMGLVTMFMTGQWSAPAYGGAFIAGLGFGPIYPTLISIGIQRFRSAAQLVTSVLTSAGSLGSLFLPTLTGYVLTRSSPIHAWLLLLGALTVTTGLWLLVRKNAEPAAKAVKPILETSNPQAQAVPANSQYY